MESTVTKRYATIEVSRPFFYYSESCGVENAKTTCLLEIRLKGHPEFPDKTTYVRSSAEWSSKERGGPNRKIGRRIAEQRARKVLEWFASVDYNFDAFHADDEVTSEYGRGQGIVGSHRFALLQAGELNDLERKIMGLDKRLEKDDAKAAEPSLLPSIPPGAQVSGDATNSAGL
ncbi:MAG: hypothetical protein HYT16_02925 [DPANN group archaeon]|nr:hypothetical protein [DPANN group archaeon]